MKPFVVFGTGQFADYVQYVLETALGYTVAAFTVNEQYVDTETKNGLPIVAFESIADTYPPSEYNMAIAFLGTDMFNTREKIFNQCLDMGYELPNVIHPTVINQSKQIGIGNIIGAGTVLGPFCSIGNANVFFDVSSSAHNTCIGDFNLLSMNITPLGNSIIGNHCYIGAGCVISNRVCLADYTLVGANALVKKDTKPYDVVVPAKGTVLEGKSSMDFGL